MEEISAYEFELLRTMHEQCVHGSNDSLVIKSVSATKNKVMESLRQGEYKTTDDFLIKNLLQCGLIRMNMPGSYILTAKGAWTVETEKLKYTVDDLLSEIDKKFGQVGEKAFSVTDRNKVVLFSLLVTRAFSKEAAVSYGDPSYYEAFWNILVKSFNFLEELNIINTPLEKLYSASGQKNKIGSFLGNIDVLPAQTFGIFVSKNGYFLDVNGDNAEMDESKLCHIIKLIFGVVQISHVEKISNFCIDVSRSEGILFSGGKGFSTSKWDMAIERCLNTVAGI